MKANQTNAPLSASLLPRWGRLDSDALRGEPFYTTMQIKIDPQFKALIPPLAPEELAQLEANILRDGCRDPLVTWQGTLIDGHNRHEICTRHCLPFVSFEMAFPDRDAAEIWIIDNQTGRRNLENIDKVPLLERKREILAREAKERQKGGQGGVLLKGNLPEAKEQTRDALAAEIGVSGKTYDALRTVANEGTDELKQAVRDKRVGASTAAEIAHLPAEKQREIASLQSRKEIVEEVKKHVHVAQNSGENEWYTPPNFIESARAVMGEIDTDPASSEIANATVKAAKFFTKEDNGLEQKWSGNVWMNPPYAQPLMGQFAEAIAAKFELGEIKQAITLVNNATETQWFQRMASVASAVCFPKSRVKFLDPLGNPGAPLQGQAILYFGENSRAFCDEFNQYGITFA
jgi:ParB family chromosome partitioning protein